MPVATVLQVAGAGALYTETNAASGNAVLAFTRAANGALTAMGSFSTGGFGTGSGLGSQGAVALSPDGMFLVAVNAGSDQLTAFAVTSSGLRLLNTVGSGGRLPISVTACGGFAYVLNAGDTPNITGFQVTATGLTPIPGSTRLLSPSAAGPAQIQFSPNCGLLVVTEKFSNTINTYTVTSAGVASGPMSHPSNGTEPFGFAFSGNDRVVVSDAASNALTLYAIGADGSLTSVAGPVPDFQTAPCWVAVSSDRRFTYAANTGSGTISGYALSTNSLTLLDANGVTAIVDGVPIDVAVAATFLYSLNGTGIAGFRIQADGSLKGVTLVPVAPGSVGLAAM